MKIAINTRFLLSSKMEGFGWYTYEVCKRIVESHPEHEFFFFFDRPFDKKFIFSNNVTPIVLTPPARHPLLFILWFEFLVKRALNKYKIDLFFSPDGYLSLTSHVPQICTIHDINFEHFPSDLPWSARIYLRYFFPRFAKKANKILTVSAYSKQDISRTYRIEANKIISIWNGASELFKPISLEEQNSIRKNYVNSKTFFLFVGSLHPRKNLKNLIKAFEIYCQNKNSHSDLLIVGEKLWNKGIETIKINEQIKSRIHFTGHLRLEELTKIYASARCLVYVPYFEGFGIPLVEAMKSGIPIISGNLTSLPEVVGDCALLVDPHDSNEIAKKMVEIDFNESLRKHYAQKSFERSKLFSWDITAEKVWNEIQKILNEI